MIQQECEKMTQVQEPQHEATTKSRFAFERGWSMLRQKDVAAAKQDLMNVFGVSTNMGLLYRRVGRYEPTVTQKEAVEAVFRKYGIARKDIWGEANEQLTKTEQYDYGKRTQNTRNKAESQR